ncbi:Methyl-accepting chemotaxis protein, partial [Alkalispirochaeta americana]
SPRWGVVYILPIADLNAPVQELTGIITTIFLLALITLALTAWVLAGRIAKPIRAVALSLDDVAQGEADLRVALEVSGRDEVGQISSNFNTFLGVLREMIGGIRGATDQLSLVGSDLSVNMEETSAAITQIAANVASLTDQVLNQSAGVSEVTATIEEISRNMESLDEQVQNQSSVVTQSSAAIEEMMASIRSVAERLDKNAGSFHELLQAADQGRVKLEGMIGINRRIAEQSSRLQEASSVIHAIAQQTNLLSMNAAIEAAHAGEYGRGFAVVAAEIRKLAEEAGAQSKVIGQELSAVSSSIQEAVASAEDVSGAFAAVHSRIREVDENEGQIRNAMEEQSAGSVQILKALEQISAVTDSVHEGSGEIVQASRVMLEEMVRLQDITQQLSNGMQEMKSGSDEIQQAVTAVEQMSGKNGEGIARVKGIVD